MGLIMANMEIIAMGLTMGLIMIPSGKPTVIEHGYFLGSLTILNCDFP